MNKGSDRRKLEEESLLEAQPVDTEHDRCEDGKLELTGYWDRRRLPVPVINPIVITSSGGVPPSEPDHHILSQPRCSFANNEFKNSSVSNRPSRSSSPPHQ